MTTSTWTTDAPVMKYDEVRSHTERLLASLSAEGQTVPPMTDVSPTKWHRAYVTWFFETSSSPTTSRVVRRSRTSTGTSSTASTRRSGHAERGPSVE